MAILDVQAMVKRPREKLEAKSSIESRSQNLAEKKNSFSRHLKNLSIKEVEPESRSSVRKELPPKNTSLERLTFEQKADSAVDSVNAKGKVEKQTPAQEKPNYQAKPDSEDEKITKANQSVLAGVETGSTHELEKQPQDEDIELTPTYTGLVQPQGDIIVIPASEESKTMSGVDIVTVQGAGTQMVSQDQEALAAVLEVIQPQAEKNQVSVELISPCRHASPDSSTQTSQPARG